MSDKPSAVVADAQYWNELHMDTLIAGRGLPVLIPPNGGKRDGERPGWTGGRFSFMRRVLTSDRGKELYAKRQQSIEPVFGHTKHNRQFQRFNHRGRQAVRTEWRLDPHEPQPHQAPPPPSRASRLKRRPGAGGCICTAKARTTARRARNITHELHAFARQPPRVARPPYRRGVGGRAGAIQIPLRG